MSESKDIQNIKFSSLLHAFEDLGYKSSISNKLFEILSLDNKSTLSIKEFVEGFLLFEEEVTRNAESFRIKFMPKVLVKMLKYQEK